MDKEVAPFALQGLTYFEQLSSKILFGNAYKCRVTKTKHKIYLVMELTMKAGFQSKKTAKREIVLGVHDEYILKDLHSLVLLNYLLCPWISFHNCYRGSTTLVHG